MFETIFSVIIPFIGTVLGAATVFFVRKRLSDNVQRAFSGFAAGVMVAAAIWSLILPSFDASADMGKLSFIPVIIGLWLGFLFLMILDKVVPHVHIDSDETEGPKCNFKKSTMTALAVALHNLPEGMAVGIVLASAQDETSVVPLSMAIALAIGIAIQNFPEGAIISLPLHDCGIKRSKTFLLGVLSGIVEPLGAVLTLLLASFITPILPYMLSFAAGAMIYVVVEELIPEMSKGKHSHIGTIFFAIGFSLMMILDIILG
ncbi:MAG: ZIP family metal transporter [Bacilli bacterium]|nr:ZIP family metal transporter [Bacilli bacterium]